MKKVLFLAVIAMALMVATTSCSKKKKCFKTTYYITVEGQSKTVVKYNWVTTMDGLAEQFAEGLISGLTDAKIDKISSEEASEYKTSQDCLAQNKNENEMERW